MKVVRRLQRLQGCGPCAIFINLQKNSSFHEMYKNGFCEKCYSNMRK